MENKLGEKIYKARKAKGVSQEQLADMVGVARQTISQWENDKFQPSSEKIDLLCKELGIARYEFYEDEDKEEYIKEKRTNIKRRVYKVFAILFSVLTAVMIVITVLMGIALFTSNTGDLTDNSYSIPQYVFFVLFAITIVVMVADAVFIFLLVKTKDKH